MKPERKLASERKYPIELRQRLIACFNLGELRTICADLGIDYDDLPGEGRADKARELVSYLERRGHIPQLVKIVAELRPNVPWEEMLEVTTQTSHVLRGTQPEQGPIRTEIAIVIRVVTPIVAVAVILAGYWQLVLKPSGFDYLVRVEERTTGDYVQGAKVIIEVPQGVPLDEITDVNGIAVIAVDSSYAQQRGKLIVATSGYKKYEQSINLVPAALPDVVQLELLELASTHTSTPRPVATHTPTPTSTPTLTATYTPTPTLTPSPPPPPSECTSTGGAVEPSVCVAGVSVQINEGTPQPVVSEQRITLKAGDALRLVNLCYCTSSEALADTVAGEAYFFKDRAESYGNSLSVRDGPRIRAGCGNVGDFEGSWIMEPGQHRVVIALVHYSNITHEVDSRFYINLHVE
jgi:hypothetical protein